MLTEAELTVAASPEHGEARGSEGHGGQRARSSPIDQPTRYPYQPALDGIRAIAVIAVVLFHFGIGWAGGGFLGVDVFLALSGFLITTLLLREFGSAGRIAIGAFYGRRARRLLPALLVVLVFVALYGHFFADQLQLVKLRLDALASLFYSANWRFIASGAGYFEQFASPSPVGHLWSLAIEEQWYLVWPLLVMGLAFLFGPPTGRQRRRWLLVTLSLAAISAGLMALLVNDADVNRVYYGTDTRAQTLLVGAGLAIAFYGRAFTSRVQRWVDWAGLGGLLVCLGLFLVVDASDTWMYRGGFALTALAATALIAGAAGPDRGWAKRVLSVPPLPELGRISYGVYLWHWPVVVFVTEQRSGMSGPALFVVRLALTLLLAIASYHLLEQPIRHHRWPVPRAVAVSVATVALVAVLVAVTVPIQLSPEQELAAAQSRTRAVSGSSRPHRLLIVGDSVGLDLAVYFPYGSLEESFSVRTGTRLGCGIAETDRPSCRDALPEWRSVTQSFDPETTLMVVGVWEARGVSIHGRRYEPRTAAYERYLLDRFRASFRTLSAKGSKVAALTVPCFVRRGSSSAPEKRDVDWLNGVLRKATAAPDAGVKLIDYGDYLCPKGKDRVRIDGVEMRHDGVHPTREGADLIWQWVAPQLPRRTK